jgi:hypothetical protein
MLYRERSDGLFEPWLGQEIDGVWHSRNIEELWSAEALSAIGLYKPLVPTAPPGKRSASDYIARVDGVVQHVCEWVDIEPEDPAIA